MGQLESYTIQDIFLVAITSGVLSTYFAEEIEATIESVAAYTYSANFLITKKKVKIAMQLVSAGNLSDVRHTSFNLLCLNNVHFLPINRTLNSKALWQDLFVNNWHKTSIKSFKNFDAVNNSTSA